MSWGNVISVGGSILGGIMGGRGSKKSAEVLGNAATQANGVLTDTYNKGLGYYSPYSNLGGIAAGQLSNLLGGDYSGFYNSPDYKAAMQSGLSALDRSAAARGSLYSGGHSADLMNFGQQQAAQYLGNYRNALMGATGMGLNTASGMANLGQNYAQQYGNNLLTGAGAQAQNYANQGQNNANMAYGIAGALGNWYSNNSTNNGGGTGWYLGNNPGVG